MSELSVPLREAVVQRADNRCEYCQLPAQLQVGGFEVDHILLRLQMNHPDLVSIRRLLATLGMQWRAEA